jgi:hypothetical protein
MTTLEQRLSALDAGNRIRSRRAEVRRSLRAQTMQESRRRAVEVLLDPEPALEGMSVWQLLTACHRLGPQTATSMLIRAGVPQHKRLSEMTDRQRSKLIEGLAHVG